MIFHWRHGCGSAQIRGVQMADFLNAKCNCDGDGIHIYVKMRPPEDFPPHSYLDIIDADERIRWLKCHPTIGIIASSLTGYDFLSTTLNRSDIVLIPQHHCNFSRIVRARSAIKVAGVVGGPSAIMCDLDDLTSTLTKLGVEFRWLKRYRSRQDIVDFYRDLDLQIVWRKLSYQRPLKNPLKLINAMSFGIPTIAYPELAYSEITGYYWPAQTLEELVAIVEQLKCGFDAQRLIDAAEDYHIENIAGLYRRLE